jgi:hypothetical protein
LDNIVIKKLDYKIKYDWGSVDENSVIIIFPFQEENFGNPHVNIRSKVIKL